MCVCLNEYIGYDGASSAVSTLKCLTRPLRRVLGGRAFLIKSDLWQPALPAVHKIIGICISILLLPVTLLMALGLVVTEVVSLCTGDKARWRKGHDAYLERLDFYNGLKGLLEEHCGQEGDLKETVDAVLVRMKQREEAFYFHKVLALFRVLGSIESEEGGELRSFWL